MGIRTVVTALPPALVLSVWWRFCRGTAPQNPTLSLSGSFDQFVLRMEMNH